MKSACDCKVTNKQCFIFNYMNNKALIKFKESGLIFYGEIEKKAIKKGLLINYNDNVIYEGGFNENAMKDDDNCCLMEFNNGRLFYGKCKEDMLMQGKMLVIDKKSFERERVVVNEMFQFEKKGKDIKFVDEAKIAKMSDNYYENIASYGVKKLKMFQKIIKARKEVEKMIKKYESNNKWKEEEVEGDLKRIEDLFREDKYEFEVCKKTKIDEGLMENMGNENKVSNMESKGEEVLECKEDISSLPSLDKDNKDIGIESEVIVDSHEQKAIMGGTNEENVKEEQIQNEEKKDKGIVTSDESKKQFITEEDKDKFIQNEPGSEKQKEEISSPDLDNKLPEDQREIVSPIEDKETGKDILTDEKENTVEPKDNEIKDDNKEDKSEENKEPEIKENKDDQAKYVDDDKKDKEDDITFKTEEEEIKEKIIPSSNEKEDISQPPSDRVITNKDKEDNIPLNETSPEETITTPIEQKEIISNENKDTEEQPAIDESKEQANKAEDNNIHSESLQEKENIIDTQPQLDESKDITEQEINNPEIEQVKDSVGQSVSLTEDKPIIADDKKEENIIEDPTKQSNDEIVENKDSHSDKGNIDTNTIKDEQLSNETQNEQIEDKTAEPKEIIKDSSDIQTQNKEDISNTQEEVQNDNIIESTKPIDEPIPITQKEEEKKQQENILPDISKDTSLNQEEKIKDTPQIEQSDIQLKENEEIIESTPTKTLVEEEKDNDNKKQVSDTSNKDDDDIQPLKKENEDNSKEIVDDHTPIEKKELVTEKDDKPISEHTQEENTPTDTLKDKEDEIIQPDIKDDLSNVKEIPTISSDKEVETVHKENLDITQNQIEELHENNIGVSSSKEEMILNDNNKEDKEEPIITKIQIKEDPQTKEEPLSTISNDNVLQKKSKDVESLQSKDISPPKDDVTKEETPLNEVTEQTESEKEKQIDDDKEKLKESPLIKEEIVLDKNDDKEINKDNVSPSQDNDNKNYVEDTPTESNDRENTNKEETSQEITPIKEEEELEKQVHIDISKEEDIIKSTDKNREEETPTQTVINEESPTLQDNAHEDVIEDSNVEEKQIQKENTQLEIKKKEEEDIHIPISKEEETKNDSIPEDNKEQQIDSPIKEDVQISSPKDIKEQVKDNEDTSLTNKLSKEEHNKSIEKETLTDKENADGVVQEDKENQLIDEQKENQNDSSYTPIIGETSKKEEVQTEKETTQKEEKEDISNEQVDSPINEDNDKDTTEDNKDKPISTNENKDNSSSPKKDDIIFLEDMLKFSSQKEQTDLN